MEEIRHRRLDHVCATGASRKPPGRGSSRSRRLIQLDDRSRAEQANFPRAAVAIGAVAAGGQAPSRCRSLERHDGRRARWLAPGGFPLVRAGASSGLPACRGFGKPSLLRGIFWRAYGRLQQGRSRSTASDRDSGPPAIGAAGPRISHERPKGTGLILGLDVASETSHSLARVGVSALERHSMEWQIAQRHVSALGIRGGRRRQEVGHASGGDPEKSPWRSGSDPVPGCSCRRANRWWSRLENEIDELMTSGPRRLSHPHDHVRG